ncbi:hypothetical protein JKP88DRAFT_254871 [Tribonema minus]|uniref:PARP catalytic domain-containing protein n=1 Tax=Tribonema minus TaxID=303371 RepID=A0A836CHC5_9STRA|nr:hypothetical protein JKP88DRAFT_254871 [Tribonema minus]
MPVTPDGEHEQQDDIDHSHPPLSEGDSPALEISVGACIRPRVLASAAGHELIDVTSQLRPLVESMFATHKQVVARIWRSNNPILWHEYSETKLSLPLTTDLLLVGTEDFSLASGLDPNRNEKLLWHGTMTEQFAHSICSRGFNLQLARSGTFGFGVYFSGDLATPLSRAGASGNVLARFLILSRTNRVLLGRPYRASTRLPGYKQSPPGEHQPSDSVVGLVSYGLEERVEFCVYTAQQIYPEYLIECTPASR